MTVTREPNVLRQQMTTGDPNAELPRSASTAVDATRILMVVSDGTAREVVERLGTHLNTAALERATSFMIDLYQFVKPTLRGTGHRGFERVRVKVTSPDLVAGSGSPDRWPDTGSSRAVSGLPLWDITAGDCTAAAPCARDYAVHRYACWGRVSM